MTVRVATADGTLHAIRTSNHLSPEDSAHIVLARAARRREPDNGHAALAVAYLENRGCRLTAEQVESLLADDAVSRAVYNLIAEDEL